MRKMAIILTCAVSMSLGACATNRDRYYDDGYGYDRDRNNEQAGRAVAGAAVGAAVGAGVGAVVDGVSPGAGAAVGAVAGGLIGAATADKNRRWYRDGRGDCYYVNDRGERIYDYGTRC